MKLYFSVARNRKAWALALLCILHLPSWADPAKKLAEIERHWSRGEGKPAWQTLEELEREGINRWPRELRRRFFMQRARMWSSQKSLADPNWEQALALSTSKAEHCEVLCAQMEFQPLNVTLYADALRDFQQAGCSNRTLEAHLSMLAASAHAREPNPKEQTVLEFVRAASLFEQNGDWLRAESAWTSLWRLQGKLGQPVLQAKTLASAERCAAKAGRRGWLNLANLAVGQQFFKVSKMGDGRILPNPKLAYWQGQMWSCSSPAEQAEMTLYLARSGQPGCYQEAQRLAALSQDIALELCILRLRWFSQDNQGTLTYQRAIQLLAHPSKPWPLAAMLNKNGEALTWHIQMADLWIHEGKLAEAQALRQHIPLELTSSEDFRAATTLLSIELRSYQIRRSRQLAERIRTQIRRLPSPKERLVAFFGYLNALERQAGIGDQFSNFGQLVRPETLAGQLQRASLSDTGFRDAILADFDLVIDQEGNLNSLRAEKASLLSKLGRTQEAVEQQQLAASEAGRGAEASRAERNLASLYWQAGRSEAALAALERAVSLGQGTPQAVFAVLAKSMLYRSLHSYKKAIECAKVAASERPNFLPSLEALGRAYREDGQLGKAIEVFSQAKLRDLSSDDRTTMKAQEASVRKQAGQHQLAETLMEEVVQSNESTGNWEGLVDNALTLASWHRNSKQTAKAIALMTPIAERLLELRIESPEPVPHLTQVLEFLAETYLIEGKTQEAQRWLQALQTLQVVSDQPGLREDDQVIKLEESQADLATLNDRLKSTKDSASRTEIELKLGIERQKFTNLLESLRSRYPEYERLASLRATELPQIQSHLSEEVVVLQLFATEEGVHTLVISGQRRISHFTPVPRKQLREAIRGYLSDLSDDSNGRSSPWGAKLSQWLLEPILDDSKGNQLILLPAGELSAVPFDSLPTKEGALNRSTAVSHAFASDLGQPAITKKDRNLLAMGAPLGSDLPGASRELKAIASLFPAGASTLLEGAEASLSRLKTQCSDRDIIHLATHAIVNPERPSESYLQVSGQRLGVAEILSLPLRPGSLVFLSACNSGKSESHQSSDLNSLAKAFRAAGASSVVYTLWPVEDESSADLASAFYSEIRRGKSPARALQAAKESIRSQPKYADPFYWAGFQILGGSNGH